jgi:DNA polymerase III subunit alpha
LIQNNFTFMRVIVKEGWADKETGKKGEPRLQFELVQYLQDVLTTFAKKLILILNIKDLQSEFIHQLSHLFAENKGDNTVAFEILEVEKTNRIVETATAFEENEEEDFITVEEDAETETPLTPAITSTTTIEETKIVTKVTMPSRKLKIKISNELLVELEKMQVDFKLN